MRRQTQLTVISICALLLLLIGLWANQKTSLPVPSHCPYPEARALQAQSFIYDAAIGNRCLSNENGLEIWSGLTLDVAKLEVPEADFANGAACGTCFQIRGPKGSLVGRVVGTCTDCSGLAVDAPSFGDLAGSSIQAASVRVQAMPCPLNEGVRLQMMDGSTSSSLKITVANHRHPLAQLEVDGGQGFTTLARNSNGVFTGQFPQAQPNTIQVRVHDIFGHSLLGQLTTLAETTVQTDQQFKDCD